MLRENLRLESAEICAKPLPESFFRKRSILLQENPNHTDPAHIHVVVKEPGLPEYYLDEYVFDDDPLLTPEKRQRLENRGGSGILTLKDVGNRFKAERNIYLGRNIPNYPATR